MPVRSAGCLTCRKRKVRCDGRRPGCERCARHGVHCSGYARERGALDFKDENNYAANRVSLRDLQNTTYQGTEDAFGNAMLTFDVKIVASNARQSWSMACDVSPAIGRGESELPPSLISVTANREQLYETFIDIFNPKDIDCGSQNFDFMRMLAILAPSHQVLRDGLDALSLMQVGSAHADQRLLGESISRHCKALRSTRNALSSGTFNEEAMLANISVLMICELFDATQGNPSAWLGHSRAFDRILLARGPDSLQSKLVMLVFYQSRYQALTRSLLRRKADSLSSPEWRVVLARMPLGVAGECMDFALQVPELLERYDALDAEVANALPEARKLLSDCERLHGRFQQWLINLQGSTSGPNGLPYTVLEVEKFPTYAALISNRTLTSGFHFHKQKLTFLYLQYWCSMYFLRSTMAHLGDYIRCRCGDQDGAVERLDESLSTGGDVELDSLVFSFCRCIPALAEPSAGAHGHTAMFLPLRIAGMHFEARCLESWTSWVDDMRANIFYNGIRPPNVREGDYPIARPLMSSNGSSALKCQMLRGGYAMEHHRHTG